MTEQAVRVEQSGPVRTVFLNRPGRRNAVDGPAAAQLAAAFREFEADPGAAVAVLHGEGGVFCSGADLTAIGTEHGNRVAADGDGPMGISRMRLSKPVIAAVAGYAVAGGLELALWCDLRIADETAVFGVFCRRWGVPLIDGGTVRLPRLIGTSRAMDMILTGRAVDAQEAAAIGLANRVVPAGQALTAARELAARLASFPQICLRSDRASVLDQEGLDEAAAMASEFTHGQRALAEETGRGAARFAAGAGRHGTLGPLPDLSGYGPRVSPKLPDPAIEPNRCVNPFPKRERLATRPRRRARSGGDVIDFAAIEDHRMLIDGLRAWAGTLPDMRLTLVVPTVDELLENGTGTYDVVLLDPMLRAEPDPAVNVRRLIEAGNRVLVIDQSADLSMVAPSLAAGAHGYLTRDHDTAALAATIRSIAAGGNAWTPGPTRVPGQHGPGRPPLSEREHRVLMAYVSGLTLDSAARSLGISPETARTYLKRVKAKYQQAGLPVYTKLDLAAQVRADCTGQATAPGSTGNHIGITA